MQMPGLHRVEGSKQPQVSALPERRVKKQRQTAPTGYLGARKGSIFITVLLAILAIHVGYGEHGSPLQRKNTRND